MASIAYRQGIADRQGVIRPGRRSRGVAARVAVALLATVMLGACGSDAGSDGASSGSGSGATVPAPAGGATSIPVAVPDALDFTAPLVGGGTFDGADLAGQPVAFWFWAPT